LLPRVAVAPSVIESPKATTTTGLLARSASTADTTF